MSENPIRWIDRLCSEEDMGSVTSMTAPCGSQHGWSASQDKVVGSPAVRSYSHGSWFWYRYISTHHLWFSILLCVILFTGRRLEIQKMSAEISRDTAVRELENHSVIHKSKRSSMTGVSKSMVRKTKSIIRPIVR